MFFSPELNGNTGGKISRFNLFKNYLRFLKALLMPQKQIEFKPDEFLELIKSLPKESPLLKYSAEGSETVKVLKKDLYTASEQEGHESVLDYVKTHLDKDKKTSPANNGKIENGNSKTGIADKTIDIKEQEIKDLPEISGERKSTGDKLPTGEPNITEKLLEKEQEKPNRLADSPFFNTARTYRRERMKRDKNRVVNKPLKNSLNKSGMNEAGAESNNRIQVTHYPGTETGIVVSEIAGKVPDVQQAPPVNPQPITKENIPETWKPLARAVAGKSHHKFYPPVPCQDSVISVVSPRAAVIACDGAGSAKLSHFGSSAVTEALATLIVSLEDINKLMLDQSNDVVVLDERVYVSVWIKHSIESIRRIAAQFNHPFAEFRSTLLLAVAGKKRIFWLRVGDGSIIFEKDNKLYQPCKPIKGEHANETTFLGERMSSADFSYGFEEAAGVTGMLACSDGAAEKLISTDGSKIAPSLKLMFNDLRAGAMSSEDLFHFLTDEQVWKGTSGDDKGIAMVSGITK